MKSTIPSRIWETKRVLITKLYEEEEWPLKQVIKALQSKDFHPSETQLRSRLKKWHVTKPSRKKWSTSKRPTSEGRTAPEDDSTTLRSPVTGHPLGVENAAHNSLCPGATSPPPLASQGMHAWARSGPPCVPVAGSFVPPFVYAQAIAGSEITFEPSRAGTSDLQLSSQPTRHSPETENEPECSAYRWSACLDPAGFGVATSALPTGTDPLLLPSVHPPEIPPSMQLSQPIMESNLTTQPRPDASFPRTDIKLSTYPHALHSERNTAPAALSGRENKGVRIYGMDTGFTLEGVDCYPAWAAPYDACSAAYPSSKIYCVQPSLWPVGNNAV